MDISGNTIYASFSPSNIDLQTRRLRLISDIMEDYQYNIRQTIQLISNDMDGSNLTSQGEQSRRQNDVFISTDYQPRTPIQQPAANYWRNNSGANTNTRRGFIYTQYIEPYIHRLFETTDEEGLDDEQIRNYTQIIQYDACMGELRCPITWDYFDASHSILRINRCGHMFRENALTHWFQNHNKCPVCRTLVTEISVTPSTQSTTATGTPTQTQSTLNHNRVNGSNNSTTNTNTAIYNNRLNNILYRALNGSTNTQQNTDLLFDDLINFYASLINTQNYTTNE